MKKINLFLLFSLFIITINSCKKDDDEQENKIDWGNEVYLLTQQDVIDFGAKNYVNFDGNIWIGDTREGGYHINTSIVDLTPLHSLKKVKQLFILSNANLTSLHGLENLEEIESQLDIHTNYALNDLSALSNCNVKGWLFIINNDAMTNIDDLLNWNLSEICSIGIYDNNLLQDVNGLSNITTMVNLTDDIGPIITITDNNSLTNLDGFSNLTTNNVSISVKNNIVLTDFCGLQSCLINNNKTFTAENNAYNPTKQDILNGNCQQ